MWTRILLLNVLCFVSALASVFAILFKLGFAIYVSSFALAWVSCVAFLIFSLFFIPKANRKDPRITLAQAAAVCLICLKGVGLSNNLNLLALCAVVAVFCVNIILVYRAKS